MGVMANISIILLISFSFTAALPYQQKSPVSLERHRQQLETQSGVSVTISSFTNWGLTVRIEHLLKVSPHTVAQIQQVVIAAGQLNLKIRCAGAGFSWSPLFPDENQILMDLSMLSTTPRISFNSAEMTVTAVASVTHEEAMGFYLSNNLAPLAAPVPTKVTLAGAAATASHGADHHKSSVITDYFTQVKLVDGYGDIRVIDDPDQVKTVAGGLGLFGIIYEVTYQVQFTSVVSVVAYFERVSIFDQPEAIQNLLADHDQTFILWFPYNSAELQDLLQYSDKLKDWDPKMDEMSVTTVKTPASTTPLEIPEVCNQLGAGIAQYGGEVLAMGTSETLVTDSRSQAVYNKITHELVRPLNLIPGEALNVPLPAAYHIKSTGVINAPHGGAIAVEWGFQMDPEFEKAKQVINVISKYLRGFARKDLFPVHAIVVRFMKNSETYSSQTYSEQDSYWMTVDLGGAVGNEDLFRRFISQLWRRFINVPALDVPRVHLGKTWQLLPRGADYTRQAMGPELDLIKVMRATLDVDPYNTFTNSGLEELFELDSSKK